MKRGVLTGLAAVAMLSILTGASKPSKDGYIVFTGTDCGVVAATDVDVEIASVGRGGKVEWTILTPDNCTLTPRPKVVVGVFGDKAGSSPAYLDLFDCTPAELRNKKKISCTFKCDPGGDVTLSYAVCVGGEVVFDPELRLKGRGVAGGRTCSPYADKQAAKKACEEATK